MISKKSRKVVAALLIGATICASGTFAYFNSKVNMDSITGLDDAQKELKITNGKINVSGRLANATSGSIAGWSYDVARVSTIDDSAKLITAGALDAGFTGKDATGKYDLTTLGATFTSKNQSPDLQGTAQATVDKDNRVKLGTSIAGPITKARPGDAFVLGKDTYDKGTGELKTSDGGIEIVNNSNLTTKIGFRLNLEKDGADINANQKDQLAALEAAGWKVYLKVEAPASVVPTNPYSDWKEFDIADFYDETAAEGSRLKTYEVASLNPATKAYEATGIKFQVRVELPLLTGNNMMEKSNTSTTLTSGLDLTKLFEVVATQENNPGWTQDGTTPADGDAFTDPTTDADRD